MMFWRNWAVETNFRICYCQSPTFFGRGSTVFKLEHRNSLTLSCFMTFAKTRTYNKWEQKVLERFRFNAKLGLDQKNGSRFRFPQRNRTPTSSLKLTKFPQHKKTIRRHNKKNNKSVVNHTHKLCRRSMIIFIVNSTCVSFPSPTILSSKSPILFRPTQTSTAPQVQRHQQQQLRSVRLFLSTTM